MADQLLNRYQQLLASGDYQADAQQLIAITALNRLCNSLDAGQKRGLMARLFQRKNKSPRGLYLWGGVGRGKTWMMDLFFDALPLERKQRIHFHRFMERVHEALRQRGSAADPLPDIAREWAQRCRVLCFDEFHVSDIADAMLLGGLLENLFEQGVVLVATSNIPPDDLYRDGLQRSRFLPAIEMIKSCTEVLHVGGDMDFRLRLLERSPIWHAPLDSSARAGLETSFSSMAGECSLANDLQINQRSFHALQRGDGIIWFSFNELCEKPRGAADYIEIARSFNTVFLSEVPVMTDDNPDAARRFINLVDEFYDRNVKLLVSAQDVIGNIYTGQRLSFEFERTESRLIEMQSHEYLARPHLP